MFVVVVSAKHNGDDVVFYAGAKCHNDLLKKIKDSPSPLRICGGEIKTNQYVDTTDIYP